MNIGCKSFSPLNKVSRSVIVVGIAVIRVHRVCFFHAVGSPLLLRCAQVHVVPVLVVAL